MMNKVIKNTFLLTVILLLTAFLSGCEETTSVSSLDKLTSSTQPLVINEDVFHARLSYGIGKSPYDADRIYFTGFNGLRVTSAADAFDGIFAPQINYSLHHFLSIKDDPINFQSNITFVSRNVMKRTDLVFHHKLPRSGFPILREDATMIAFGTKGETGNRCHMAMLSLRLEKSFRAYPEGFSDAELETGSVIPLAWAGPIAHALLILDDGRGIYFLAEETGKTLGSVNLTGAGFREDEQPGAWLDPTVGSNRLIIGIEGGYFLVDTESFEAEYHKLTPKARVLGLTQDGRHIVWAVFDRLKNTGLVRLRNIEDASDDSPIPFAKGLGNISMTNVFYSPHQDCIFFEATNDIWRMDLGTGIYGKFTDTPREHEDLLWVL